MPRSPWLPNTLLAALVVTMTGCPASPGVRINADDAALRQAASGLVASNAGRLVGKVKDGSAGIISQNASSIISQNASSVISQNAGAYWLNALADRLKPIEGAKVEVTDAGGHEVSYASVSTDASGTFTIRRLKPSSPLLYVRVTYQVDDQTVVLRAVAPAPRQVGTVDVQVDPAGTLVAKKVLTMIARKALSEQGVEMPTLNAVIAAIADAMDDPTMVAATLQDEAGAARAFDALLQRDAALHDRLDAIVKGSALVRLLEPTPAETSATPDERPAFAQGAPAPNTTGKAPGTTRVAGGNEPGYTNGTAEQARFNIPFDVASGPDGSLYVADSENHGIRKIAKDGTVTMLTGNHEEPGFANGDLATARFNAPSGVAMGADGTLYVADYGNHRIRKITPQGQVSTLAGTAAPGFADGPGVKARFSAPSDLSVDASGTVYVADTDNHRVRKIMPDGTVSTLAGTGTPGLNDGPLGTGLLSGPSDVAISAAGEIYVADTGNHAIRAIREGSLSTLAGNGTAGYADASGASARFNTPFGLGFGPGDILYVADANNHSVRMVAPDGHVGTFWGVVTPSVDVPQGLFNGPSGLGIRRNATGAVEVFVADANGHAIRKFSLPADKSKGEFPAK